VQFPFFILLWSKKCRFTLIQILTDLTFLQLHQDNNQIHHHQNQFSPKIPNPKSNQPLSKPPETLPKQHSFPLPSFPFNIEQRTSHTPSTSSSHTIETLPSGFFSKSISFSKIRKPLLNLEYFEAELVVDSSKTTIKSGRKKKS